MGFGVLWEWTLDKAPRPGGTAGNPPRGAPSRLDRAGGRGGAAVHCAQANGSGTRPPQHQKALSAGVPRAPCSTWARSVLLNLGNRPALLCMTDLISVSVSRWLLSLLPPRPLLLSIIRSRIHGRQVVGWLEGIPSILTAPGAATFRWVDPRRWQRRAALN